MRTPDAGFAQRLRSRLACGLIAALAPAAAAQVTMVQMQYSAWGTQTVGGATPTVNQFAFDAHLYAASALDFFNGGLIKPNATAAQAMSYDGDSGFVLASPTYATQTLLLSNYPAGTYRFDAYGGFATAQTLYYFRSTDWWPSTQPAFTAATFTALQAIDPAQPLTCRFNTFSVPSPANASATTLEVVDLATSLTAYYASVTPPATSITIPANTLYAGVTYDFILTHSSRQSGTDGSQTVPVVTLVSYEKTTHATGTCPPPATCIADFNQDGGVDGADVESFFLTWQTGESGGDVNQDGGVDGADIETFLTAWAIGGC